MSADLANDTLLVTCASGKQASHLIPFLLGKWHHLRLVVNSDSSRQSLLQQYTSKPMSSKAEIIQADLAKPDDCHRIMKDVTVVYHIGPSFHEREAGIGYSMIDAAVTNKVQHFVFSSVLHPNLRKLVQHDIKIYVEEYLIESGLQYTILQPSHFMDLFPIQKVVGEDKPTYTARFDPETPFTFTCLHDLGEAAAKILEQREQHFWATYEMVSSSPPVGYRQVCELVSKIIGKEIKLERMTFQESAEHTVGTMLGITPNAYSRDAVQRLLLYYEYRGLIASNNVMRWVLGREPTQWEGWVKGKMAGTL